MKIGLKSTGKAVAAVYEHDGIKDTVRIATKEPLHPPRNDHKGTTCPDVPQTFPQHRDPRILNFRDHRPANVQISPNGPTRGRLAWSGFVAQRHEQLDDDKKPESSPREVSCNSWHIFPVCPRIFCDVQNLKPVRPDFRFSRFRIFTGHFYPIACRYSAE